MNSILLRNYEKIDGGATGMVYDYSHGKVIKVFSPDYPFWKIEREYNNARSFNESGLPSPKCYEIVSTDKGFGIIFERINGISLTKAIANCPAKLDDYVEQMVELMRAIHRIDADPSSFNSVKDKYLEYLTECHRYYSNIDIFHLKSLITAIPDTQKLLHGDLHTGNIMVNKKGELIFIDFAEVCYGHPIFDIMAEGAIIPVTLENDPKLAESYLGIPADLMQKIWKSYMHFYFPHADNLDELMSEARLISRLRNAITAAITDGIPEVYLENCAQNTHSIFIPEIPRLTLLDWHKWE